MTAYGLNGRIFCQKCYRTSSKLTNAVNKSIDNMTKHCEQCGQLIYTEGKAPF